jgi:uncharacterized protein YgiB involved in biofilm formation
MIPTTSILPAVDQAVDPAQPARPAGRMRRAASRITLVLIGSSALAACSPGSDQPVVQDSYATLEDCKADWDRPEECQLQPGTAGGSNGTGAGGGLHGFWYGPSYRQNYRPTDADHSTGSRFAPSGSRSASVSRGGFGSTGFHFGSGS